MLKSNDIEKRWSIFPITHGDLWSFYKKAEAQTWVVEENDLSADRFNELPVLEQEYLKNLLAFFTISDGLVLENLAVNFLNEVDILEAQYFYGHQTFIEQVHSNQYSILIDTYIKDRGEQLKMFNAISEIETVKKKAEWALKWIGHQSFAHRLVAFSLVEGLSFSSTFAGIFYFRSRNKMLGLCTANELIMGDENLHYEFGLHLYNNYLQEEYKLSNEELEEIVLGCYEVEKTFVEESMPDGLEGLTKEDMIQFVQYITDSILINYNVPPKFNVSNPLDYMNRIALKRKNNFFENRVGEYTRIEIPSENENIFLEDF